MGQILHGSAKTTHAVRAAIQRSKATIAELAEKYHLNPKTVIKWRRRQSVEDRPMGPQDARSTVLSAEEEALCVAFRKHTLLPLDDCLYALQASIPHLTRSSLHRLFQRHDISRLPNVEGDKTRKKFKAYPIGYFHIVLEARLRHDIAEVRTEEGKLYMFVAIDRASKLAFVELHDRATRRNASEFLRRLIKAVPYKVHTVLTDNGVQFCHMPQHRDGPTAQYSAHMFERICRDNGIEHRLTRPNHPWTNDQVEHEPITQRGDRQALLLRKPRPAACPPRTPTTSPSGSRLSRVSPLSSTSATAGQKTRTASPSIQPTSSRDQTTRLCSRGKQLLGVRLPPLNLTSIKARERWRPTPTYLGRATAPQSCVVYQMRS